MSWDEVLLIDKLESVIDYRGKTPKKSESGVVTLSAKSVKMGYIDYSKAYHISQETYKKFMVRGFPKKGDILMTTEAPLGCIAKLNREDVSVAQRLLTFRANELELSNDYLMYFLMSPRGQFELKSRATGTTVQGIKKAEFVKVKILLPPLQTQKRIADILSAYDDLIENNLKRIKLLEQAAQNIYKEWFVNLRFPGHENTAINEETGLPEGWKYLNFSDVAKFSQGLQVGTNKQYSSKKEGQKRFIRIVDVTQGEQEPRYVDCINSKYEVEKDDLFMIRYGSPKVVMGYAGVIANNFFRIKILKEVNMNNNYLYAFLNRDEITKTLMNYSSSATMPAISFKRIANMQILCPDFVTQEKYSKLMDANWSLFFTLNKQNQKLKAARDILLPRLMNRTIEV